MSLTVIMMDLARSVERRELSTLLVLAFSLAIIGITWKIFYNIYLHPLAKYPGPKFAAASRLWYCQHCISGRLPFVILGLHKRYGSVVRIAPDELSYTDPDGWNDIYGHRAGKPELTKDALFYSAISSGPGSIINAHRSRHGLLRKKMSHGFSERALRDQEDVIRTYSDLVVQRLRENCGNGTTPLDLVKWFNYFTFDVMGDLVFGESFKCLEDSAYHPWVVLIFDSVKTSAFVRCVKYFPMFSSFTSMLVPKHLKKRRAEQRIMAKAKGDYRKSLKTEKIDLISGFLQPDSGITDLEYQSSVETLIIAGSETTATLMSGVSYYLMMNPEKMTKLVTEIRNAFSSPSEINFVSVNNLPYLLACLNEALRVYPPVADAFPRNTGPNHEIICGRDVPPNTVVRMSQWATYHSPENFAQPDDFIPERWLDEQAFENDSKKALQPFHVGPRNCLGRNLAYVEMRLLITLLLWNFDMTIVPESRDWKTQEVYLLWEKPALMVRLKPRADGL